MLEGHFRKHLLLSCFLTTPAPHSSSPSHPILSGLQPVADGPIQSLGSLGIGVWKTVHKQEAIRKKKNVIQSNTSVVERLARLLFMPRTNRGFLNVYNSLIGGWCTKKVGGQKRCECVCGWGALKLIFFCKIGLY
ncbi:hypothetical protein AVEN_34618-1 [Araneus ventricosus]|uniref:Uncharacterized protein n=1 Tax=Araneus ventricosus TaxID=182803 RepID=A0A4Y2B042_ARAVE|nr:hypothetical protein AVEN_34618-1 [Araneus ventricosus]